MEVTIWDLYFTAAVGMLLHPGHKNSLEEAVEKAHGVAFHMEQLRKEACPSGSHQQS